MQTIRLIRLELTVAELTRAEQFYIDALGFTLIGREEPDPAMTILLGGHAMRQSTLRRDEQTLVLQEFLPVGARYPEQVSASDQVFQHFAMPVSDMGAAFTRLAQFAVTPISSAGPQRLPVTSGGAIAFKFRDPDGHPLELIQFPNGDSGGIDHSAISVANVERSIAFYQDDFGFRVAARQINEGIEQDQLDGLHHVRVGVIALAPEQPTPHLELLAYQRPLGRPNAPMRPHDIAATRTVLEVTGLPDSADRLADGAAAALVHDPDGHLLLLIQRR